MKYELVYQLHEHHLSTTVRLYFELDSSASLVLPELFSGNLACISVPLLSAAITIPSQAAQPILCDLSVETVTVSLSGETVAWITPYSVRDWQFT
jgi:hypothetical protein